MSYTPTEWNSGDIVTSEKLNKLENGVAGASGGVLLVTIDNDGVLDRTWQEINDAAFTVMHYGQEGGWFMMPLYSATHDDTYRLIFASDGGATELNFQADSPDDYPAFIDPK